MVRSLVVAIAATVCVGLAVAAPVAARPSNPDDPGHGPTSSDGPHYPMHPPEINSLRMYQGAVAAIRHEESTLLMHLSPVGSLTGPFRPPHQ
jgi:hypothetical protein